MDRRLFEAAMTGSVSELVQLLKEEPLVLHTVALTSGETPLHVAALAGQLDFVKEIIRLKPEFAGELNQDGRVPLHVASANGYIEIVKELLKVNPNHCRLPNGEKWTALHYAAMKGRIAVIEALIISCNDCVEDVTARGETAIHLAMMNSQFEAVRVMIGKLKQLNKESVLNMMDLQGNTVLHVATVKKQRQMVELLLDPDTITVGMVDVNLVNKSNLTPLDFLLQFPSEAGDREIEEVLRHAGAMRALEINSQGASQQTSQAGVITDNPPQEPSRSSWVQIVDYFKFRRGRDSPNDARGAVFIVAGLISAATYQAVLQPPGGCWQDGTHAGKAIWSTTNKISFMLFSFFNTIAFTLSLTIIELLLSGLPLRMELEVCICAMGSTYGNAMISLTDGGLKETGLQLLFTFIAALFVPSIAKRVSRGDSMIRVL